MIIELGETATYSFSEPVEGLALELRMKTLALPRQIGLWSGIQTRPAPKRSDEGLDAFGNSVTTLFLDRAISRLVISAFNRVLCLNPAPASTEEEIAPDCLPQDSCRSDAGLMEASFSESDLDCLARELRSNWHFDPTITDVHRPLDEIAKTRRGVCQDMCRLAAERLRQYGVPARFVVGYRIPVMQRGSLLRHAWIAARIAGRWIEVDLAFPPVEARPLVATAWGSHLEMIGPVIGKTPVPGGTVLRAVAQGTIQDIP